MAKNLTDEDLIVILRKEEQTAQQWQDAELLTVRQRAYDYYDRNVATFGSEEGQSSVVTSEVADTIESVMPGLMRVFASGEAIAEFTPMDESDEQAAKEATQYVPHVLMRENNGFRIIYWFCKDVLMYRLATLIVDTDEVEKTSRKPIQGVTEEVMAALEAEALELGATEVVFDVEQDPTPVMPALAAGAEESSELADGGILPPAPLATFSGTVSITRKKKRVVPDNVAPEDLLIAPGTVRDIDDASYAGYRKETTASALRELGLSQDDIDGLSANRTSSPEEDQRQGGQSQNDSRKDDQRRLWLVVAYVKADSDGDGISEMLRVVYAHAGGENGAIIERMEWEDGEAPITIGSAILMSHSIVGRSLFDQTADLQEVGTEITRAMLDNTYQVIRPRPMINNRVPILSVLDHTAGMPIQIDTSGNPAENITYLTTTSIIDKALAALGYLENKRDQRTGTSRMGNNMDDDALADASRMTKGGTQILRTASQERQELMARTLAATAFTRFLRHIYRAIKRCASGPIKYYAKDEWHTCDPTQWPDDMHLIVEVGTGTGDKMQEQANLVGIGAAQEKIIAAQGGPNGPVVTLEHIANTGRKLAEASGYRATTHFFASDKDVKQAMAQKAQFEAANGPPIPPEVQREQAKTQGEIKVQQAQLEGDMQKLSAEAQRDQQKAAMEAMQRAEEMQLEREKMALEREKMDLERAKLAAEHNKMMVEAQGIQRDQEHDRQMKGMDEAAKARGEQHERMMARAGTEQGAVDGVVEDHGKGLTDALRESVAASRENVEAQRQTIDGMLQAFQGAAQTMTQATTIMANVVSQLAEQSNMETEVTTSTGKTLRARKVPRRMK